jgi:hypothetical protein
VTVSNLVIAVESTYSFMTKAKTHNERYTYTLQLHMGRRGLRLSSIMICAVLKFCLVTICMYITDSLPCAQRAAIRADTPAMI